jgi:hypothetical protein
MSACHKKEAGRTRMPWIFGSIALFKDRIGFIGETKLIFGIIVHSL